MTTGGGTGIQLDARGVGHHEAFDGREPEAAVAPLEGAVLRVVALGADHPGGRRERHVVADAARARGGCRELRARDAEDAAVAGQPEIPAAVFEDALRRVVKQPLPLAVSREPAAAVAASPPRVANQ